MFSAHTARSWCRTAHSCLRTPSPHHHVLSMSISVLQHPCASPHGPCQQHQQSPLQVAWRSQRALQLAALLPVQAAAAQWLDPLQHRHLSVPSSSSSSVCTAGPFLGAKAPACITDRCARFAHRQQADRARGRGSGLPTCSVAHQINLLILLSAPSSSVPRGIRSSSSIDI